jgi:hypothetical protein
MAVDVVTPLNVLKALGINAKDWLIKAAKSKTIWFATLLTIFGGLETFLPSMQGIIPTHWYGTLLSVIGIVTALLRFATTSSIADKPVGTTV